MSDKELSNIYDFILLKGYNIVIQTGLEIYGSLYLNNER